MLFCVVIDLSFNAMKKRLHTLIFSILLMSVLNAQQPSFDVRVSLPAGEMATHSFFPSSGGVILAGTYINSAQSFSIRIMRHDSEGEVVWVRTYTNPRYASFYLSSMVKADDGGFWLGVNAQTFNSFEGEALLVKFDSAGLVVNEKYIKAPDSPFYSVGAQVHLAESEDGSLYVAFNQNNDTLSLDYLAVVMRLNAAGNLVWTKVINQQQSIPSKINATNPNRIHIGGSFGQAQLITFDSLGQVFSSFKYSSPLWVTLGFYDWHIDSAGRIRALLFSMGAGGSALLVRQDTTGAILFAQHASSMSGRILIPSQNDYITAGIRGSGNVPVFCNWQQNATSLRGLKFLEPSSSYYFQSAESLPNGSLFFVAGDYSFQSSSPNSIVRTDMAVNSILPQSGCVVVPDTIDVFPFQAARVAIFQPIFSKQNSVYSTSSVTGSEQITVQLNCKQVGITEFASESGLQLYPNPASGLFTVTGAFGRIAQIRLFNAAAQLAFSDSPQQSDTTYSFDVSMLPEGLYLVQAILENGETISVRLLVAY
jgi:hypothetical protein